jgi:Protein of unknown function (DUF3800)
MSIAPLINAPPGNTGGVNLNCKNMGRVIHVYCDESRQTRERFMVLGAIVIPEAIVKGFNDSIAAWRKDNNMLAEMKWGKVSNGKLTQYKQFVDYFFARNDTGHAHFHALIIDTTQIDPAKVGGDKEVGFYKFYYQLLLHCCGKLYCQKDKTNSLLVFMDYRNSSYSLTDLKKILNAGLNKNFQIDTSPFKTVEPRDSHACELIQMTDLFIGAIGYKKNGYELFADASVARKDFIKYIAAKSGIADITTNTPKRLQRFTVWNFQFPK